MRPLLLYAVLLLCAAENTFSTKTDIPESSVAYSPVPPSELPAEIAQLTPVEDRFSLKRLLQERFIESCKTNNLGNFSFFYRRLDKDTLNQCYIAAVRAGNAQAVRTLLTRFGVDPNADNSVFPFRFSCRSQEAPRPYDPEITMLNLEVVPHDSERHTGTLRPAEDPFNAEICAAKGNENERERDFAMYDRYGEEPSKLQGMDLKWSFKYKDALLYSCEKGNTEMVKALLVANIADMDLILDCLWHAEYAKNDMVTFLPALLQYDKVDVDRMFSQAIENNREVSLPILLKDTRLDKVKAGHAIYEAAARSQDSVLRSLAECGANPVESLRKAIQDSTRLKAIDDSTPDFTRPPRTDQYRLTPLEVLDKLFEYFKHTRYSTEEKQDLVNCAALELASKPRNPYGYTPWVSPSERLSDFMKKLDISSEDAKDLLENTFQLFQLPEFKDLRDRRIGVKNLLDEIYDLCNTRPEDRHTLDLDRRGRLLTDVYALLAGYERNAATHVLPSAAASAVAVSQAPAPRQGMDRTRSCLSRVKHNNKKACSSVGESSLL